MNASTARCSCGRTASWRAPRHDPQPNVVKPSPLHTHPCSLDARVPLNSRLLKHCLRRQKRFLALTDQHSRSFFWWLSTARWFGFRLDGIVALTTMPTTLTQSACEYALVPLFNANVHWSLCLMRMCRVVDDIFGLRDRVRHRRLRHTG